MQGWSPFTVLLSTIGATITTLGAYFGVRLTSRTSRQAQAVSAGLEQAKVNAAAYDSARTIWDAVISDLREQVADQRKELAELRASVSRYHSEISQLQGRFEDLETKRSGDRRAIHVLTVYARALLQLLKDNGIAPPPAPVGLALD